MMIYTQPPDWREVEESDFEDFLKTCADYTTDSYSNAKSFMWRHNKHQFAVILGEKIFVDPSLLVP